MIDFVNRGVALSGEDSLDPTPTTIQIRVGQCWAMKDKARESFYDTYFPDDIPDEWSLAERAKSHGRGASADLAKTIQSWYGHLPCTLIWKPLKYAPWDLRIIPGLVSSWALKPVRRVIRPEAV